MDPLGEFLLCHMQHLSLATNPHSKFFLVKVHSKHLRLACRNGSADAEQGQQRRADCQSETFRFDWQPCLRWPGCGDSVFSRRRTLLASTNASGFSIQGDGASISTAEAVENKKGVRLTSPPHFWKGALLAGLLTVLCRFQSLQTFTIRTAPLAVLAGFGALG